jgi:trigger factor
MEFVVPLSAEVALGDFKAFRLSYEPPVVNDAEVDEVLDNVRQRQALEETADRPADVNDRVHLRLSARRYGSEQDDATAQLIGEQPLAVIIPQAGSETPIEWPFSGFSRELIGASAEDEKTILYTYPEDSEFESLRGQTAEFSIRLVDVKSRTLPELNDEFAQSLGEYADVESLRKEIRSSLETRALKEYNSDYDDRVVDAIVAQDTLKYPPQMVDNEIHEVIHQLERRLKSQGVDLDTYLKTRELDQDGLHEEARPVAETRVKRSLVLFKVAEEEDIKISENDLQEEADRTINSLTQFMSEAEKRRLTSRQVMPDLVGNIYAEMRIERTLEHLRTIAQGEPSRQKQESSAAGADEEGAKVVPSEQPTQENSGKLADEEPSEPKKPRRRTKKPAANQP